MSKMSKMPISNRKTPFCKVCQDAGKSENEYTSHWVKDLTGKTTCPTLLKTECRLCFNLGHTSKFCEEFKKKNKYIKPSTIIKDVKPKANKQINNNCFACLDSDNEEEVAPVVEKEPSLKGWAAIVAKPKSEFQPPSIVNPNTLLQDGMVILKKGKKMEEPVKPTVINSKPAPWCKQEQQVKSRWADLSDDEDDASAYEYAVYEGEDVNNYDEEW